LEDQEDGVEKGMGVNFVTKRDIRKLREIESYYSTEITELPNNLINN
jgi:hypothetical protein